MERRRHPRVRLRTPVRGAIGASRVYVTDGSIAGMAVAHQRPLPPPGGICRVELASDWGPIRVDCQVVRTVKRIMTREEQSFFVSGLEIVVMDRQSEQRLQTMIATVSHDDF